MNCYPEPGSNISGRVKVVLGLPSFFDSTKLEKFLDKSNSNF